MNGSSLDYLDQAEGNGYNNGVKPLGQPNAIQQVRQRMIGSLSAPFQNAQSNFGIAANDNVIHIAPQSGIPDVGITPTVQLQKGLIGRTFDSALSQATAGNLGHSQEKQQQQSSANQSTGAQQLPSVAAPQFSTPQFSTPQDQHLGDKTSDGYYKLNSNYFDNPPSQQGMS